MTGKRPTNEKNGTSLQARAADPAQVIVVLPALNEAAHIEKCIRSLFRPKEWIAGCRIVVADGESTDGTQEIVCKLTREFSNLRLIKNPGRLQSAGVNTAVEVCAEPQHRVLVRCDVHSIYPEGYIRNLLEEIDLRGSASVVTAMDATGRRGFQRAAAWIVDTPLGSGGSAHRGGKIAQFVDHGHHAAFDLDWFRRIGGYDPAISHNEDAEYDLRLARAGGTIWLTNKTRVGYTMRPSIQGLWRQYWNYGHGRANTLIKHCVVPRMRQILPVLNIWLLATSMVGVMATPLALAWPILYVILLVATSAVAMASLRSIDGLWAGPALATIHIAWGLGFMQRVLERPSVDRTHQIQTG